MSGNPTHRDLTSLGSPPPPPSGILPCMDCLVFPEGKRGHLDSERGWQKRLSSMTLLPIVSFWSLLTCTFFCLPANAQTDDPFSIRVQSNLVLVHTEVYGEQSINKGFALAYTQCRTADGVAFASLPFFTPFTPSDCFYDIVVHGLGVSDFHLFEDGIEQKIESVRYEREPIVSVRDNSVRDNLRFHVEWSYTPRGKWSTIDLGTTEWGPAPAKYFYRLAYVPSKPEGKCHKIKVNVDRHFAVVYAEDQYCYTTNLATDPLDGTRFGRQMETDLNSKKKAIIPLSAQASFVYTNLQSGRVDVVLEFPWNRIEHHFLRANLVTSIGVLGVAYKKDHTVATRFTDFGCCASGTRWFAVPIADAGNLPSRYETQIDLPAGEEYELRVVLSDRENFGRVEIPLKIDSYDGKNLAISSVVLSDRFRDAKVAAEEAAGVNLALAYVPLVSGDLQFTPTAHTNFKSTDHLIAYFELYEPLLTEQPKTQVQARVKLVDAQSGETRFQFAPIAATSLERRGSATLAVTADLPLAQLPKGNYIVEAQATDSAGSTSPMRTATFTIQ